MAAALARPGVEVIQAFRSISPSIAVPTLVPSIIGPAFQVVSVLNADGTIEEDALVAAPAVLESGPGPYLLEGKTFTVIVNEGAPQSFVFSDPDLVGLSAEQVVAQMVASATPPAGFIVASVTRGADVVLQVRTIATGDGASLKVDAPALVLSSAQDITDPVGLTFDLVVNGVAVNTPAMTGPDAAASVIDINAIALPAGFDGLASAVGEILSVTASRSIVVGGGTGNAALGFTAGTFQTSLVDLGFDNLQTAVGISSFRQSEIFLPQDFFPDPNGNLDELDIIETDIEAFLRVNGLVVQLSEDSAFLRNKTSTTLSGTADLTSVDYGTNTTLVLNLPGAITHTITFNGVTAGGAVIAAIDTAVGIVGFATLGAGSVLVLAGEGFIEIAATSTALTLLGLATLSGVRTGVVVPVDPGGGLQRTRRVRIPTEDFTTSAGAASVTSANAVPLTMDGKELILSVDGKPFQSIVFSGINGIAVQADRTNALIRAVNVLFPGVASAGGGDELVLTSLTLGTDSSIRLGASVANSSAAGLGFTTEDTDLVEVFGAPNVPKPGDSVFGGGVLIGNIAQVTPDSVVTDLVLDNTVSLSFSATSMYIVSNNLTPQSSPKPELIIDLDGNITVKANKVRTPSGNAIFPISPQLLVGYKALRVDLSAQSATPGLLTINDLTTLQTILDPLDPTNPLGYGMFLALLNSPTAAVTGLGLSAVSGSEPEGTLLAYTEAADFLEAQEIYAIAPLTHAPTVHQMWVAHVTAMSQPAQKGERVVLINPVRPSHQLDTLALSGTEGNGNINDLLEFDTGDNVAQALLDAGADPNPPVIPATDGIFLIIGTDSAAGKRWSVNGVSGTKITVRTTFQPGENDDGFYTTDQLPLNLIDVTFNLSIRGAPLTVGGVLDKTTLASTLQGLGQSYSNRRVLLTTPDTAAASVNGIDLLVPGYYLNCATAGMVGQQAPQQGFTNFPMVGFTRVIGSNDLFSETQLDVIAAGGVYIYVQDVQGGPITSRHQLTTDSTSIETREFSITRVVDFAAKFMRAGLRNFIGKYNITTPFLDSLGTVVQGQLAFLVDGGVILGGDLNNVLQDTDAPDTVLIDSVLEVPFPANYIRLTLVV